MPGAKPTDFFPRAWFGDYVERTLAGLVDGARARGQRIDIHATVATGLQRSPRGLVVEAEDGKGRDFSAMLPRFVARHRG